MSMDLDNPMRVAEKILQERVSTFFVQPVRPLIGTHRLDSFIAIGDKSSSVTQVGEHLGKVVEVRDDGSVIIEQEARSASKTVKVSGSEPIEVLAPVKTPVRWRMRVSKIDRFVVVE